MCVLGLGDLSIVESLSLYYSQSFLIFKKVHYIKKEIKSNCICVEYVEY
jgi:hypothetical protein